MAEAVWSDWELYHVSRTPNGVIGNYRSFCVKEGVRVYTYTQIAKHYEHELVYSIPIVQPQYQQPPPYQTPNATGTEWPRQTANQWRNEQTSETRTVGEYLGDDLSRMTEANKLDDRFRVIKVDHQHRFFKPGKVFMALWIEPAGSSGNRPTDSAFTEVPLQEFAYSEIRRFIVLTYHHHHSLCIPIQTYGDRGTLAQAARPYHHAQVYSGWEGTDPPNLLANEILDRPAFRVEPDAGTQGLRHTSRINFGKVYTIEHNIRVCAIGKIADAQVPLLRNHYREVQRLND